MTGVSAEERGCSACKATWFTPFYAQHTPSHTPDALEQLGQEGKKDNEALLQRSPLTGHVLSVCYSVFVFKSSKTWHQRKNETTKRFGLAETSAASLAFFSFLLSFFLFSIHLSYPFQSGKKKRSSRRSRLASTAKEVQERKSSQWDS